MTIKAAARPASRRVGMRWGLRAKSVKPAVKVSYCCRTGKHGIQCASLSCGCACH
jgi:hypothetical protein